MSIASVCTMDARDVQERLARCIATMVYYHKDGWSWNGAKLMDEESRSLADWVARLGIGEGVSELILRPLDQELTERFGAELGLRLGCEFRRAMGEANHTENLGTRPNRQLRRSAG